MFEAHEFELPMNFEGLWMVSKTPGTAARGAPNAPKDCQRDHGPREASTYVCYDVWYYMCVYAHGKRALRQGKGLNLCSCVYCRARPTLLTPKKIPRGPQVVVVVVVIVVVVVVAAAVVVVVVVCVRIRTQL